MMARKHILDHEYRIGGDLIDRLSENQSAGGAAGHAGTGEAYSPPVLPPAGGLNSTPDVPAVVPFPGVTPEAPAPEYPLTHRKDGLFELFTIGDLEYRLGGVKPLFVTSLRVNIRAGNGERSYYDGLDLYLARGRTAFSTAVQRALGAEPARVERDLVRMLEYLERERDASLILKGKETVSVMTAAEKEAGMELLTDPKLFDRVVEDLSALGYVGEDLNKQLLYLCASSRKLDDPMSVLILSQSASGKSFLVDCVKRLMPPEEVIAVTSLSDQALNYISDLTHKFLILGEAVHSEAVEHQIREMLSGKELSRLVVEKDPDTGRMESRLKKMPVIVSSVMGSTSGRINPENASRCFLVNADESREQTERIHESQRHHHGLDYLLNGGAKAARSIAQHQAAQRLLQKRHIVNDFAQQLAFPAHLMRTRRDHERFLNLIDCVCFVRQYQKKTESEGAAQFIRCDLEDYRVAYRLMVSGVLSSTMEELSRGSRLLYEQIRSWVHTEARRKKLTVTDLRFTQRQIREVTGLGHTWIKANMRKLVDYEYLEAQGKERSKTYYRLPADDGIIDADLSMIPSPQAMEERLAGPPR